MGRISWPFLGIFLLLASIASAQDAPPNCPGPQEFVLLQREPQALNLDSLKGQVRICDLCWEISGKVAFRVLIDEYGHYVTHIVLNTPHELMTKVFEPIVPHIRWTLGILPSGKPTAVWVTIPFQICGRR